MTTTETAKATTDPNLAKKAETVSKPTSEKQAAENSKIEMVTLDALACEMKMSPRDARMMLRLAAKQTKIYPTLGKEHIPRQPWQWTPGSKALDEARKALAAAV